MAARLENVSDKGSHQIPSDTPTSLFIGGEQLAGNSGSFDVTNPATGDVLATIADADVQQGIAALDAAVNAQTEWARTTPQERADLLRAAYDAVIARKDDFAKLMTLEMGKPSAESYGEVTYGASYLRRSVSRRSASRVAI